MPALQRLRPGTRFRLAEMPEITGVLVKANECRAVVRLDRPERDVEFVDQEGQPRQFKSRGSHVTSWAPTTVVAYLLYFTTYTLLLRQLSPVGGVTLRPVSWSVDGRHARF